MNILFVGEWDIAGAYISDRLIREGHEVCWMTEEESRILWNKKFKGGIYRGNFRREDYMRILKERSVDTVIYLTGKLRENYEEFPEYNSRMLDLTNLLNVLRNYPLKRLIYLSSLELAYKEIYTPVLTELAAGEMLCEAYHNAYELPVMILRLGSVYGNFGIDNMGYTGYLVKKFKSEDRVESLYSASDYIDPIYGEDMAMAVHLLLQLDKKGRYSLMTGHPLTMKEYYTCIGDCVGRLPVVTWRGERTTASEEFFLSDNEVKMQTGWIPFYLLQGKGGIQLRKALTKLGKEELRILPGREWLRKLHSDLKKPFVREGAETLALFALTSFLLQFSSDVSDLKYVDIRLMFVAIVSCMHGARMGLLSIVLASASYLFELSRSQVDISFLLYSVDTWVPFVVYTVAGAAIGYMVDRRRDEKDALQENYNLLEDKYEFLKTIHGETLEIKGSLQRQIITSKYSFGNAYEVAVELDSLKPELILLKVISILENIMDCDKAAVFLINSNNMHFARLKACSRNLREDLPNSLNMDRYEKIYEAFYESNIFVNDDLLPDYPDYAAPIYYQDRIFGFVVLYDIGVEKFTVYFQNLFKIITSLIEKNLVKALEFENAQRDAIYYPGTELLYPRAFEERLHVMEMESNEIAYSYIQARIYPKVKLNQQEIAERIASVIRGSDFMGIDQNGNYAVILVNMTMEHLDMVRERFERKDLTLEVV